MAIATGIKRFLDRHRVIYCPIAHQPCADLFEVARSLNIDESEILQALPLTEDFSPLLAVLPLNRSLDYQQLRKKYHVELSPMPFEKANKIFWDCEPACYPPFGLPYGLKTILDKKITLLDYVYFIGGSRQSLVKMSLEDFQFLNADASFFDFSYPSLPVIPSSPWPSDVSIYPKRMGFRLGAEGVSHRSLQIVNEDGESPEGNNA